MKRAVVATIAILMFTCVLPMAQGQESAPKEQPPTVVREQNQPSQDQQSQDIAKLQAQLEQLMAQQQELQKQLRALSTRRNQVESQEQPSEQREPARLARPRRERAPAELSVAPVPPVPPAAPKAAAPPIAQESTGRQAEAQAETDRVKRINDLMERAKAYWKQREYEASCAKLEALLAIDPLNDEALTLKQMVEDMIYVRKQPQVRDVQEQVQRAKDEAKRAMKEAARAQQEAERAQAESGVQAQAQDQQDRAKTMRAYGEQMKKWSQSEEMQKWQEDMAKWGQQMGRWGQEFGSRQTGEAMNDAEQPQMPPMPAMPPISVNVPDIHMPAVESPVVADKQDGREEAVSRLEQAVDLPAGRLLEVANEIGSISVLGGDEPGCRIVATVKSKAETKEEAQRIVDQVKLVVTPSDDKVRVSLTKPENQDKKQGQNYQVTLEVRVPREVQIRVSQAVGSIRLTNLRGSVEASTKVGSIQATSVSGRVALSADVGSIEVVAPKDLSAQVQAKANIGSIQSDFPLDMAKPRGVATGSSASGTIGGGDGELSLKTNVGSIRIRAQGAEPRRAERSRPEPRPRPEPRLQSGPDGEF